MSKKSNRDLETELVRRKRPARNGVTFIGGSSLLVMFSVLCMTVFALLSLSTVRASTRLSDRNAQAVYDFYSAEKEAETILASIRNGIIPENVSNNNGVYSYSCNVSGKQYLCVDVTVDENTYSILRWQVITCE